jgi:cytochrome b561
LIAGHIAATLVHTFFWRDRTLARMWRMTPSKRTSG